MQFLKLAKSEDTVAIIECDSYLSTLSLAHAFLLGEGELRQIY
jgi:hypothetical protein